MAMLLFSHLESGLQPACTWIGILQEATCPSKGSYYLSSWSCRMFTYAVCGKDQSAVGRPLIMAVNFATKPKDNKTNNLGKCWKNLRSDVPKKISKASNLALAGRCNESETRSIPCLFCGLWPLIRAVGMRGRQAAKICRI